MKSLPPLKSLRAFEAAARHMSFKRAGEELHVTPAAISQQVRLLEDSLGEDLFRRGNRSLELTETGRAILPDLCMGFESLARAMDRLRARRDVRRIRVAAAPAFVTKWLVNHLNRFPAKHPELNVEVRVLAAQELIDYGRQDIDVGIRYGLGAYTGLESEKLLGDALVPVCSPKLLRECGRLKHPDDLAHLTLLHDDSLAFDDRFPTWEDWLRKAGAYGVMTDGGLRFSSAADAIMAAIQGFGPLLERQSLVGADIAAGRLTRLFDIDLPLRHGFHVVYARNGLRHPEVRAFRDWLFDELPPGTAWL